MNKKKVAHNFCDIIPAAYHKANELCKSVDILFSSRKSICFKPKPTLRIFITTPISYTRVIN